MSYESIITLRETLVSKHKYRQKEWVLSAK
jgi:hypothetical protein